MRRVYEDGRIDPLCARFSDFEDDLAEALRDRPAAPGRAGTARSTDTIAELSTWYCFSPAYLAAVRRKRPSPPTADAVAALRPKVGRNDPCPCGSGRKYKKCCLP